MHDRDFKNQIVLRSVVSDFLITLFHEKQNLIPLTKTGSKNCTSLFMSNIFLSQSFVEIPSFGVFIKLVSIKFQPIHFHSLKLTTAKKEWRKNENDHKRWKAVAVVDVVVIVAISINNDNKDSQIMSLLLAQFPSHHHMHVYNRHALHIPPIILLPFLFWSNKSEKRKNFFGLFKSMMMQIKLLFTHEERRKSFVSSFKNFNPHPKLNPYHGLPTFYDIVVHISHSSDSQATLYAK